jgi:hypothetical protein
MISRYAISLAIQTVSGHGCAGALHKTLAGGPPRCSSLILVAAVGVLLSFERRHHSAAKELAQTAEPARVGTILLTKRQTEVLIVPHLQQQQESDQFRPAWEYSSLSR